MRDFVQSVGWSDREFPPGSSHSIYLSIHPSIHPSNTLLKTTDVSNLPVGRRTLGRGPESRSTRFYWFYLYDDGLSRWSNWISNWASGSFHLLLLASNLDGHSSFHWRSNPLPQWRAKVTIYPVYAFGLIVAALLTSQGPPPWVLVLQVRLGRHRSFAHQGRTSKVPVMDNRLGP